MVGQSNPSDFTWSHSIRRSLKSLQSVVPLFLISGNYYILPLSSFIQTCSPQCFLLLLTIRPATTEPHSVVPTRAACFRPEEKRLSTLFLFHNLFVILLKSNLPCGIRHKEGNNEQDEEYQGVQNPVSE